MIRDITLGQYYPVQSFVHRLDPRVKITAAVLYIIELFIVNDFPGFAVCAGVLAAVVGISRVPPGFIMRGLKPILIILIFTFCLNIFMIDGRVLYHIGPLRVTDNGLYTAVFMSIRLILLIIGTSLLTLTTTPISLTDGIERLLSPLNKVGVATHEIAMMMSIALRFIPTLMEETDKIIKAQQARGADFESGNIFARAKSLIPILVPLFVSAFRIAQDLAMAMEARCYRGGAGRTRMNGMKMGRADALCLAGMFLFLGVIIGMRIMF
ncbi:MAG: energy-coupling factor transporter transmembrane protein EcfT [Clostridiales bacterium]|jgi:energy-coupling factor transport system permease protein|uniref:energy-coupling factor transporter transmembrane component T family protein n=1 Tax=Hornefia butyriciproducens TaxID=2652293 RepID=UPI0029F6299F|nr:energy-coupling factor transporter transmembrane component T [Hornefia butyriciproducens]MCI7413218.1 energy-coupling factor transporter transmembrane protein EcfT [Clostridiales bacterium]MCI7679210.1 energy-coupling factor transporter transmembrane protein EcfT [Clostridiales bacterium]MDD7019983.1 energy-coupling factor transporter transmembrane component T [Hornefia butyriciproducens]MDY5462064.1 energy-coupling factor transporter transmembrane component T [Hornefia butyriciproducens]MD